MRKFIFEYDNSITIFRLIIEQIQLSKNHVVLQDEVGVKKVSVELFFSNRLTENTGNRVWSELSRLRRFLTMVNSTYTETAVQI